MELAKLERMIARLQNGVFIGQELELLNSMADRGELNVETLERAIAAGQIDFDHEIWGETPDDVNDIDNDGEVDSSIAMTMEMIDSRYVRTEYEYFSPLVNGMENWSGWFQLIPHDGGYLVSGWVAEFNPQTMQKNLIRVTGIRYYSKDGTAYANNAKCTQWGKWDGEYVKPSNWILKSEEKEQRGWRSSKLVENHTYRNSGQVSNEFWAVVRFAIIEWRKSFGK